MIVFFFRLTNTLHKSDNEKDIWRLVKNIRKNLLKKNTKPLCNKENTLVSNALMKESMRNIEQIMNISNSRELIKDVSQGTFETAAKMFTYLNYCPPKLLSYYKNLFGRAPVKNIISALIR